MSITMQAKSIPGFSPAYDADMKNGQNLNAPISANVSRVAREAAGLSQREVAAQLGIAQPSYALWEQNHVALRPDQLLKLAGILGVRVEELLDPPSASNRRGGPAGKARRVFEAVSLLPRSPAAKNSRSRRGIGRPARQRQRLIFSCCPSRQPERLKVRRQPRPASSTSKFPGNVASASRPP